MLSRSQEKAENAGLIFKVSCTRPGLVGPLKITHERGLPCPLMGYHTVSTLDRYDANPAERPPCVRHGEMHATHSLRIDAFMSCCMLIALYVHARIPPPTSPPCCP